MESPCGGFFHIPFASKIKNPEGIPKEGPASEIVHVDIPGGLDVEKKINHETIKARQPITPIIILRGGPTTPRIPLEKQIEPDEILPCRKIVINDDEEDKEEWVTQGDKDQNFILHDEMGKQESETLTQNSSKANKECGNVASAWRAVIQFCSTEICSKEDRVKLAAISFLVHVGLLYSLRHTYQHLLRNNSDTLLLSLGEASTRIIPAIMWNLAFIVSFVYTVMMVWSSAFPVTIILMPCLTLLCGLSMWTAAASGFNVICGSFRMNGILFLSIGVLGGFLVLFCFILFWSCLRFLLHGKRTKQDEGVK